MGKPLRYLRGLTPTSIDLSLLAFLDAEFGKLEAAINFLNPYGLWDDLQGSVSAIRLASAGITPPSEESGTGLFLFSASATNTIVKVDQITHEWLVGSPVKPHAHWMPTDTGSGNVVWQLERQVVPFGSTWPGSWTTVSQTQAADSGTHQVVAFGEIDLPDGALESTIVVWRLSRLGADGSDTYGNTARLLSFDTHMRKEKHGTVNEYPGA